jgi:hypothetical protein
MTMWRLVPFLIGVLLALLAATSGFGSGFAIVAAALLVGAIWPAKAMSVGARLALPLVVVALIGAARHSAGLLAIAVVAAPFAVATTALLALAGSYIGHAIGRGNEIS